MNLADNLKRIRKDNNLSQEQLAEKLGVSRQAVSKWESGVSYPEMDKVIQICKLFKLNINEFINEDIKEIKENREVQVRNNKYISSFFDYITKSIDMFSSMSLKEKIKCLVEQCIIGIILVLIVVLIGAICSGLMYSILNFLPESFYYPLYHLICSLYIILGAFVGGVVLLHIFKIRYLDYYEIVKDKKIEEPVDEVVAEETISKIENKESTKNKIVLEKKQERIVIRDPKHTEYKFFSGVGKVMLWFIKMMACMLLSCFAFTLIGLMMCLPISFLVFESGTLFVGLLLSIVGASLINIIILRLIYNFIVSKKINKTFLFAASIVSLIVFGLGLGIVGLSATSFKIEEREYDLVASTYEFDMSNDILIGDWEYYDNDIEFVEKNIDNVQIVINHSNLYKVNMWNYENDINMVIYTNEVNVLEYLKLIIEDINHKVIGSYDYQVDIVIYANKSNLNIIQKNRKDYNYRIDNCEKELYRTRKEYMEVSTELDKLKEIIINSNVEVIIDKDGEIVGIKKYNEEIE